MYGKKIIVFSEPLREKKVDPFTLANNARGHALPKQGSRMLWLSRLDQVEPAEWAEWKVGPLKRMTHHRKRVIQLARRD